jgi:DNA-binding MarR family transcriptional regulator
MDTEREPGRLFLHLKAAQTAMRAALCDVLSEIGITPPQLLAMRALERTPRISSAELARQCFVSPQAMVTTLARMEQSGLIERSRGGGRVIETHLTSKGLETLGRAADRIAAAEIYLRETLGSERIDALTDTLEALTEALERSEVVTSARCWDLDE